MHDEDDYDDGVDEYDQAGPDDDVGGCSVLASFPFSYWCYWANVHYVPL